MNDTKFYTEIKFMSQYIYTTDSFKNFWIKKIRLQSEKKKISLNAILYKACLLNAQTSKIFKIFLSISWSFNFIFLLSISDNARPTEKVEWYQEHLKPNTSITLN